MWQWLSSARHLGVSVCALGIPRHSPFAPFYGALVCGLDVPPSLERALFQDTGLIHILVVSGAHLALVERLCRRVPARARMLILALYAWATDFGAPVVRAFVRRVIARKAEPCGWTALQIEAATSLACVLVIPPWAVSRSFLMSWLCALALNTPFKLTRWRPLDASLKIYVALLPFTLSAPLTIAWNALFAPFIGEVLFPASLLAFVAPPATAFIDLLWRGVFMVLEAGPRASANTLFVPIGWIWWVPWVAHSALLWGDWRWRRASSFF